ncbi:ATP-binding protein [Occultella aeris]|uniref:Orc1-like AAA ATPase domain-containing protein n=1 Tax=Occultella aeris TaxID=2761496 RepID=A0A7M4DK33_9MICO|nr:ATP-binding protein [Occultella aeris]VZO37423.1 hypothetical protein HALOF300_02495 [Occultella aeris]
MGAAEPPGLGQLERLSEALARTRELGFVGRAAELRSFTDALAGTSASRILFVHGPGGIGKTTLLDAFSRHEGRDVQRLGVDLVHHHGPAASCDSSPPPPGSPEHCSVARGNAHRLDR